MKKNKLLLVFVLLFVFARIVFSQAMFSPTWGFFIDLPPGYQFVDGDARDRFSFSGPEGLMFDIIVYHGQYNTIFDLVEDINRRLQNQGYVDFFEYGGKQAAVISLEFGDNHGWGLAVELAQQSGVRPMLLALSYNPVNSGDWSLFHLSALDSIAPTVVQRRYPGPIMQYSFPRGEPINVPLAFRGLNGVIHENDAEAAQILIEREFAILRTYLNTTYLHEAFIRYYRFIFRDSFARIEHAASVIVRELQGHMAFTDEQQREFAQRALTFIQGFHYERDFTGSDFINLVTAITEGRGSCDNYSMLFAVLLTHANIRSAMMVSLYHSHALGLADIAGIGARFDDSHGTNWLVAETTANVDIGMIAQDQSDPRHWFAILFD
ncbi:MAG: hypothetical protein FWC97_01725 [Treponema sp.]|nr:hypothetical protein [Treponema sp.]